jgi:hypothetical protein
MDLSSKLFTTKPASKKSIASHNKIIKRRRLNYFLIIFTIIESLNNEIVKIIKLIAIVKCFIFLHLF